MEFLVERFARLSGIESEPEENIVAETAAPEDRVYTLRELREAKKGKVLTESVDEKALVEQKVRNVIRSEIDLIIKEMQEKDELGWMFRGMTRPKNSTAGKITTGFPGLGFKREDS